MCRQCTDAPKAHPFSNGMKSSNIEISWNTLWRVLFFMGLLVILYVARHALGVLFFAIVISLGIDPAVSFLEKKGLHRILGTIFVFLFILFVFSIAVYFIAPKIVTEAGAFLAQFNDAFLQLFGFGIPESAIQNLSTTLTRAFEFITSAKFSVGGAISTVFKNIVLVVSTVIISFYLTIEKNGPERFLRIILPEAYESSILKLFNRFKRKMRIWLLAQLGLSLVVGIVVSLGLWLLGVRYALTLGLLAAVFEIVPVIGPILSGAAALLIALSESLTLALYVLILFVIVQQLENNVLIPLIMGKTMRVHPVMVLIALLAGGQAAGLIGIVLAVPVAILAQETFTYLAEKKDHKEVGI